MPALRRHHSRCVHHVGPALLARQRDAGVEVEALLEVDVDQVIAAHRAAERQRAAEDVEPLRGAASRRASAGCTWRCRGSCRSRASAARAVAAAPTRRPIRRSRTHRYPIAGGVVSPEGDRRPAAPRCARPRGQRAAVRGCGNSSAATPTTSGAGGGLTRRHEIERRRFGAVGRAPVAVLRRDAPSGCCAGAPADKHSSRERRRHRVVDQRRGAAGRQQRPPGARPTRRRRPRPQPPVRAAADAACASRAPDRVSGSTAKVSRIGSCATAMLSSLTGEPSSGKSARTPRRAARPAGRWRTRSRGCRRAGTARAATARHRRVRALRGATV